MARVTAWT